MSEPQQAVIDVTGTVCQVVIMDAATVQTFRDLGFTEMLWPGCTLVDVTDTDPQPGIGWTYADGTFTAPPQPDPPPAPPADDTAPAGAQTGGA